MLRRITSIIAIGVALVLTGCGEYEPSPDCLELSHADRVGRRVGYKDAQDAIADYWAGYEDLPYSNAWGFSVKDEGKGPEIFFRGDPVRDTSCYDD